MKKFIVLTICTILLFALASCSLINNGNGETEGANFPVEINEDYTLYEAPQRVISLSPSLTEIIFALGSYAQLAAVSDNCNHPAQALELPRVGTALSLDVDAIVALNPDLILTSTPVFGLTRDRLALRNIPIVVLPSADSLDELHELYAKIATMLSGNNAGPLNAENTLENMFAEMERLTSSVNYTAVLMPNLNFMPNSSALLNLLVEKAGFNLPEVEESDDPAWQVLLEMNPDFVFASALVAAEIMNTPAFATLGAAIYERIIVIDADLFERQGARLIELVERMNNTAG